MAGGGIVPAMRNAFAAARDSKRTELGNRYGGTYEAGRPGRWAELGWPPRGRNHRPGQRLGQAAGGTDVWLRDGSPVVIRQIRAADAPLVADIFAQLSPTSRWMRFLGPRSALSAAELHYLTDVDHDDHEALAAIDRLGGRGVGDARYIRHAGDPQAAEVAITVVDAWHRRGLGTELLAQLSVRARQAGISRLTGLASAHNVAIAALLRTTSARVTGREADTVEYEITLATQADQRWAVPRPR
jgi:RimJ/RimL family protein N-acetyltransferase